MMLFSLNKTPVMDKYLIEVGAAYWSTDELHDGKGPCCSLLHWPASDLTVPESLMRCCASHRETFTQILSLVNPHY